MTLHENVRELRTHGVLTAEEADDLHGRIEGDNPEVLA